MPIVALPEYDAPLIHEGHLPRDLFRLRQSGASDRAVLAHAFPSFVAWAAELKYLFDAYVQAKSSQNVLEYDDLLL